MINTLKLGSISMKGYIEYHVRSGHYTKISIKNDNISVCSPSLHSILDIKRALSRKMYYSKGWRRLQSDWRVV